MTFDEWTGILVAVAVLGVVVAFFYLSKNKTVARLIECGASERPIDPTDSGDIQSMATIENISFENTLGVKFHPDGIGLIFKYARGKEYFLLFKDLEITKGLRPIVLRGNSKTLRCAFSSETESRIREHLQLPQAT
jgi:hypothetical protein